MKLNGEKKQHILEGFTKLKYYTTSGRKGVIGMSNFYEVSSSTIYRVVREGQASCSHEMTTPYSMEPEYQMCRKCGKDRQ